MTKGFMSVGEQTSAGAWRQAVGRKVARAAAWAAILLIAAHATPALSIDNPDAPDLRSVFVARAQGFEQRLADEGNDIARNKLAAEYTEFLGREINTAYGLLVKRLDGPSRAALLSSQRQWEIYRSAEQRFIAKSWTRENFGSSAAISRADYRNAVLRQRAETLLDYLRNYPALDR